MSKIFRNKTAKGLVSLITIIMSLLSIKYERVLKCLKEECHKLT